MEATTVHASAATRSPAADATWLVALAAALWGLDGVLRKPLATDLPAGTIVLWEHIIVAVILLPFLPTAITAWVRCRWRDRIAVAIIGLGASAVATALFTQAFALAARHGDYITPLVLQKLQPLFAIALAVIVLRERPHMRFAAFVIPALFGVWLLTFADPLHVRPSEFAPAMLGLAAAALWASGTVLGRLVGPALAPRELTTLRFVFGLVGAFAVTGITSAPVAPGWANIPGLIGLAVIPGLIALLLYYRGLARTPAARATLAELAFPVTAAGLGALLLGTHLVWTQWAGFAVVVATVGLMGWWEARRHRFTSTRPPRSV